MKQSGIILHISSLNTDFGIGDLGPAAYRFADYLAEQGHSLWQILPLNYPGYGNSPYNPISAFAFNEYLISPELLCEAGLLRESELITLPSGSAVDFAAVHIGKDKMHAIAAERYLQKHDIHAFIAEHALSLKPYLCFSCLSAQYGNSAWYTWPETHRSYSESLYHAYQNNPVLLRSAALQAIFSAQLHRLKQYLVEKEISLFGDLPLYLSYDSAEVWANQALFDLDAQGTRQSMAGVPPDSYSCEGQLWGNPVYKWSVMAEDGFELFIRRIAHALRYLDLLRLDHFIGYVNYWQVPSENGVPPLSTKQGSWVKAMPEHFFARLKNEFGSKRFVAEDLGILNADVCHTRDSLGLPGMIILQFCFEESVPTVADFPPDRFIYTGTHDNNTTRGWWDELAPDSPSRRNMEEYCRRHLPEELPNSANIHRIMRRIALQSGCQRMIFPMQDVLGMTAEGRMNIPGTALGNWQWRMVMDI